MIPLLLCGRLWAGPFYGPETMVAFEGNLRSGYAFANVTSPSVDGKATVVARIALSYLYYQFPGEGGAREAASPGLGFGVGVRWRPPRVSLTALGGYEARHTVEYAPDGTAADRADHGLFFSGDSYLAVTPTFAVAASAYYGVAQRYVWGRALARRQVLPWRGSAVMALALGVDGTVQGNDHMRSVGGGVLAELNVPGAESSFGVRVGLAREVQPGAAAGYAPSLGTSIYKSF